MKTNVRYAPALWLLVLACNRPDSDLFGDDGGQGIQTPSGGSRNDAGGASATGAGATESNGASPSGGMLATGGKSPSDPSSSSGGSEPMGGSQMDQGSAGNPSPPDMTSMAGAGVDEGTAGSAGMKPADPVCGNGMLEAGEECDDAGHAGQDGCDENCKVVCAQLGAGTLESEDHHCYNGYDQGSFKESQDACVKRGAHLATISSAAENKLAQSLVHGSKWLGGLEDVAVTAEGTGAYGWITKEPFTFTNWAPHEPNREQTRCNVGPTGRCFEHCVSINGDGTWADRPCDMVDGYVCEWEPAGQ